MQLFSQIWKLIALSESDTEKLDQIHRAHAQRHITQGQSTGSKTSISKKVLGQKMASSVFFSGGYIKVLGQKMASSVFFSGGYIKLLGMYVSTVRVLKQVVLVLRKVILKTR